MDKSGKNRISGMEMPTGEEKFLEFIEAAAHDLQAPLRKLSLLTEIVFTNHRKGFDDDAGEYIRRISNCLNEMQTLIDGLTDLAKTARSVDAPGNCDLSQIAKNALETVAEEIKEKNVIIEINPLPMVHGIEVQYKQLFKNLFENAIKFRDENIQTKIKVSEKPLSATDIESLGLGQNKKYCRIDFSDNGIGFNEIYAEKIFEPFIRLQTGPKYPGHGLGLAICKKIVANQKGIIYAERNEKKGSRFVVILPQIPRE